MTQHRQLAMLITRAYFSAMLLPFALPAGVRAQAIYSVTVTSAADSGAVFSVRLVAPGWRLTVPGASATTILDDTIRVNVPLRLDLTVDDAAVADFFAPDSSRRIRVRVEGRDPPRTCDESRPRFANKCPARSVLTSTVGVHIALDIVRGEPQLRSLLKPRARP